MSTRMVFCLITVLALAAVSGPVVATPAYPGFTGLIFIPTADTLKMGNVNFGAGFVHLDDADTTVGYWSANVGLIDSLEVGGALLDPEDDDTKGIVNAKFSLLKETLTAPAIAVGISDLTDEFDSTPYVVLSKGLTLQGQRMFQPRLHIGVGGGKLDGLFGGLSMAVSPKLMLMVEHDTENVNFGLQFAAANALRLRADLIDGDNYGFGLNYTAGF